MINIAICDDQIHFIKKFKSFLLEYSIQHNIEFHIDEYLNSKDLIEANTPYQIIFLDINLEDTNDGIDVACMLRANNNNAIIVLVTSMLNRYRDGYKANVFRYLEKPIKKEEFKECIHNAVDFLLQREDVLKITFKQNINCIFIKDIIYIESYNRQRIVFINDSLFRTTESMQNIRERLDEKLFAKIQKSFLVNLKHVKLINHSGIVLSNNKKISFSRGQYDDFIKQHIEYLRR